MSSSRLFTSWFQEEAKEQSPKKRRKLQQIHDLTFVKGSRMAKSVASRQCEKSLLDVGDLMIMERTQDELPMGENEDSSFFHTLSYDDDDNESMILCDSSFSNDDDDTFSRSVFQQERPVNIVRPFSFDLSLSPSPSYHFPLEEQQTEIDHVDVKKFLFPK